MKCMNPILIYYDLKQKKYSYLQPERFNPDDCIFVPCGKCPACRNEWRTQLAQRVRYELQNYNYNEKCFLTLTVNEEMIYKVFPGRSLDHSYFQKFIKRLRRYLEYHKIPHKPLKYFMCGEYGTKEGHRPHIHLILFGWKPEDLKMPRRSKKGYVTYESELLNKLWNAGFVNVGDISEHTAPYMAKYIVKFSEIPQGTGKKRKIKDTLYVKCKNEWKEYDDNMPEFTCEPLHVVEQGFCFDDIPVRKPYLVYPKKIMGLDYFLDNYKQILRNGYIYDSNGNKHGIPKSFKKWIDNRCEDPHILQAYNDYLINIQILFEQEMAELSALGYTDPWSRLEYYREQGRIKRTEYESFKNKYR